MKPISLSPSLLLLCGVCPLATALDHFVVGPRAQGMAGANVAGCNDETAQYYNPAAFGFMATDKERMLPAPAAPSPQDDETTSLDEASEEETAEAPPPPPPPSSYSLPDNNDIGRRDFGFGLDISAQYRLTGALSELIDELQDIDIDRLGNIDSTTQFSSDDLDMLIRLYGILPRLDDPGTQVQVLINGGAGFQVGHLSFGVRNFTGISAFIREIDTENLGFDFGTVEDLSDSIEQTNQADNILPADYTNQRFSPDQEQRLADMGFSAESISVFDYYIDENINSGPLFDSLVDNYVDLILDTADAVDGVGGGGPIEDNRTAVAARGVSWVEIPVTYGYAINENLSVGLTGKYMLGRVYGISVRVFDEDLDIGDVIQDALENYEESSTFGIDAGIMYRMEQLQFGLVGRNLNSPEFDGYRDEDNNIDYAGAELDPELVAGAAWIPFPTLSLEASLDLLEQDAINGHYKSRYASVGAEWDVLHFLALRGGLAKNLAESEIGPTVDVGLGLNLGLLRIDLALGAALETNELDGSEIPKEGHVSFGLSSRW